MITITHDPAQPRRVTATMHSSPSGRWFSHIDVVEISAADLDAEIATIQSRMEAHDARVRAERTGVG